MIIKPEKVNNVRNRFLEHIGISMVVFVGGYLAILYIGMRYESRSNTGILTYLLSNDWAYLLLCCAIVVVTNIILFLSRINKKNVCGVEFKDDLKELVVFLMPYYSNKFISVSMPYSEYSLEVNKKVSELQDKYLELKIKQNNIPVGRINGNDTYWSGQKKYIDRIIKKSTEIRGMSRG